jgi:hypothetical protein
VAWNETDNWYDDPLGGGGSKTEVEGNGTTGAANAFTIGQRLRGSISSTGDLDYFSFSATQGVTYIFWCDSLKSSLAYGMRIFCSDGTTRLAFTGCDATSPGTQGFIVWTAPTTATYFFRMAINSASSANIGGYRVETGADSPSPGERARDHRDVFVAHSDDGTTWAAPTRVNDDAGNFDDWLPEVVVAADGLPYVMWFDWRDAANCGGNSNTYVSRSSDGGATWNANQVITSAASPWTTVASNIAPNQGDYNGMYGNGRFVHPSWADGRGADVDVWAITLDTGFDLTTCANDTTVSTGTTLPLTFSWANRNLVFPNDYTYNLTDHDGWVASSPQPATLTAGASKSVTYNVPVPSPASAGNQFIFSVTNSKGTVIQQCVVHVTATGNVGVTPSASVFGVRLAVPNPAVTSTRIDYSLPREAAVRLVIYGLHGERVRTLVDGVRGAGPNSVVWDARDHRVSAGAYYYRLEGLGQSATRRLVLLP